MGVKGLTLKKLASKAFLRDIYVQKKQNKKTKQMNKLKHKLRRKRLTKNKRERYSYYACFNLRNVLFWFYIYSNTEKKCQGLYA